MKAQTATPEDAPFERVFIQLSTDMTHEEMASMRTNYETRNNMKLSVEGDAADVARIVGFWEVGGVVPDLLLDTCSIVRSSPTPLQARLLPLMLNGKDVVGIAPPDLGHSMVAIFWANALLAPSAFSATHPDGVGAACVPCGPGEAA